MANWSIRLTTRGNPDFQQYAPITNPETLTADTLPELRDKIKEWKSDWNVGMGNWMMPLVRKDDAPVGYMSYSGRLWNQEAMDETADEHKKKYGQYWPKQLEVTGDDPEPMVLVTSKLLDECRNKERNTFYQITLESEYLDKLKELIVNLSDDIEPIYPFITHDGNGNEEAYEYEINEEAYEIEEWHRETD